MPELPEVQTTVSGLRKKITGRKIISVWSDWQKVAKSPAPFSAFQKLVRGKKVIRIERRGKNIVIYLSGGVVMVAHQKMTGHFMVGKFSLRGGKILAEDKKIAQDSYNRFIHLAFGLSGGKTLALSDVRKFAHIYAGRDAKEVFQKSGLSKLGPEATDISLADLTQLLGKQKGPVKAVLMDQSKIAGIGNIYADEILWQAKVNPFSKANHLIAADVKNIFKAIHKILPYAIKLGGTSTSDYRDTSGQRGKYDLHLKAYQRTGKKCLRCGTPIERKILQQRAAHFCPRCQIKI